MKKLAIVLAAILVINKKKHLNQAAKPNQMFKTNRVGITLLTLDFTLNI